MSVFDGEIDFRSTTMVDYGKKEMIRTRQTKPPEDNCLIAGLSRDVLKPRDVTVKYPDILCPLEKEYYKKAMERFKKEHPKLYEKYMTKEIDPVLIENEIKDRKRTEYLLKYCPRDLPFMSVNLGRRAKALQSFRLPDDVYIPATTQQGSFRRPGQEKYVRDPSQKYIFKPKSDNSITAELRKILRVRTGESNYTVDHGILAEVILKEHPFGPPRKEPKYGRWINPYYYTYRTGSGGA